MNSEITLKGEAAKQAGATLGLADTKQKNEALIQIARLLEEKVEAILQENKKDLVQGREKGLSESMLDRLALTKERILGIAQGVRQVVALTDPNKQVLCTRRLDNGLVIEKTTVPFGVIGIIYEARPNVTVDAAVLCIKSGNACLLRGGSEALHSNKMLVSILKEGLQLANLDDHGVELIENTDRALVGEMLKARSYLDLIIPRGGVGLISFVVENSTVPVIETGSGVCHTYVDEQGNIEKAIPIVMNAKVSRPSVCNAMETLLIHEKIYEPFLQRLVPMLKEKKVEVRGDDKVYSACEGVVKATEQDWATEYNDLILSIKVVSSAEEAIRHIQRYSTKHSECIVTENKALQEEFLNRIDAAAVYVNASTRFTDGFEFGFGAEIGISTQKMHARGPMGLEALVSYKYKVYGNGQIR